jgi:hypothetical protein
MDSRHVGWNFTSVGQKYNNAYFDPSVIDWIRKAVMFKTMGVSNKPIQVTDRVIVSVLDTFLSNHRSYVGDIHTRFHIPGDGNFSGDFGIVPTSTPFENNDSVGLSSNYVLNQVVEFISEYIKTEAGIISNNKRFSAWSALYGANDYGLQAHPKIKLREKRPIPFQFNMKF